MPPKRTRKVESDDEGSAAEEVKTVTKKPSSKTAAASASASTAPTAGKQIDAEGNTYFEIGGRRRIIVRPFKDMKLVDIREMYPDKASGELKPGKKGIALSEEQFLGLVNVQSSVIEALNSLEVEASTSETKKTTKPKPAKAAKEKPASKPAAKKKARKEVSESEDDEE